MKRSLLALAMAIALLLALPITVNGESPYIIARVSVNSSGIEGNGPSVGASISGDGRLVAFHSYATNLHPDDTDSIIDIFLHDRQSGETALISRASGVNGAKGNGDSTGAQISADDRFVAFGSLATNLHPDDTDDACDVFVRDLANQTTILVSRASGASGAKANQVKGTGCTLAISADGRFVAFESTATNLDPNDTDYLPDIYVRDIQALTTTLVSRASGLNGTKAYGFNQDVAISGNGRIVSFLSSATNLDPDDSDQFTDIYVRDLDNNMTEPISRATGA